MVRIKHKLKDAVILFILPEQIFAGFSHFAVGFHVLILRYNVQKLLFLLWHMVDSFKGFCLSGDVTAICTALLQAAEEFGTAGRGCCTERISRMLTVLIMSGAVVVNFAETGCN